MAQRLDYVPIPNTTDKMYLTAINKVVGHVARTPCTFKELREWLRDNQLWDKETSETALSLMGVQVKPEVGLLPLGAAMLATDDDAEQKKRLFLSLRDQNLLLTKAVLEALDVPSGGRLHSTYELHRMLTSYVYPGKHIGLPEFQAWVKWMQACDGIRLIGIRWGLGDVGKAHIDWLKSRDYDEILEDEEEEGDEARPAVVRPAGGVAPQSPPIVAAPAPVAVKPAPRPAPPDEPEEPEEDEDLDLPPEAAPVDEAVLARYLDDFPEAADPAPRRRGAPATPAAPHLAAVPAPTPPTPRAPAPLAHVPAPRAAAPGRVRLVHAPVDAEALERTARWIEEWWAPWPDKRELHLADLGVDADVLRSDPGLLLVTACTAAIAAVELQEAPHVAAWLDKLRSHRAIERIWVGDEGLAQVLADVDFFAGDRAGARLSELLVHALGFAHRVRSAPELPGRLAALGTSADRARVLAAEVMGGNFDLAPIWVAVELERAGVWPASESGRLAVPTWGARENAYRLGYIDALYADGLSALLDAGAAIGRFFGTATGGAAALENLPDHLGCAFRCGRVESCPLACREKIGR
jgi:hypothetical protein